MFEMKDKQSEHKKDGGGGGWRGKGGKGQGQRKEEQYEDGERSDQGKCINMCRRKDEKSRAFFMEGHKSGGKQGLRKA